MAEPKPPDLMAIRRFMMFCMAEQELETLLESQRPPFPPGYPRPGSTEHCTKTRVGEPRYRSETALAGNQPVANVFHILRRQGVRLFRHRLEDAQLSGVTVSHPKAGVCVLVNCEDDLYRQFFSAAHEYGHVLFDREDTLQRAASSPIATRERNWWKSEPTHLQRSSYCHPLGFLNYPKPHHVPELLDLIGTIARDYHVNTETVVIRMKELHWITDRTLDSFRKAKPVVIQRSAKRDPDLASNLADRQAERLEEAIRQGISPYYMELLRRALTEDRITWGRFAEMLDMTVEQSREFIISVGMAI